MNVDYVCDRQFHPERTLVDLSPDTEERKVAGCCKTRSGTCVKAQNRIPEYILQLDYVKRRP